MQRSGIEKTEFCGQKRSSLTATNKNYEENFNDFIKNNQELKVK